MLAIADLQAAIRAALRDEGAQTDQAIWQSYFFGSDEDLDGQPRADDMKEERA